METLSAITLWGYQETLEELKNKLWATICELEEVKNNARDEILKKEDSINQLIQLVKKANQERDEAKDQLQILLNKISQSDSVELFSLPFFRHPESPQLPQALGSSSMTDSDNFAHSCTNASISQHHVTNTHDEVMKALFDQFAKKPLPEKGRLLKAVIDAGPILNTLFVAGSLPRWRNPPPLKPLLVPPLSIRGDGALNLGYNLFEDFSAGSQSASTSSSMPFYGADSSVCRAKRPLLEQCAGSLQCLTSKRQKSL